MISRCLFSIFIATEIDWKIIEFHELKIIHAPAWPVWPCGVSDKCGFVNPLEARLRFDSHKISQSPTVWLDQSTRSASLAPNIYGEFQHCQTKRKINPISKIIISFRITHIVAKFNEATRSHDNSGFQFEIDSNESLSLQSRISA